MVPEIIWSVGAIDTYNSVIDYLQKEWTDKEISNFAQRVSDKLQLLQTHPKIGSLVNKRHSVYRTVVLKRVTLYYRFQPVKKKIELVTFWDNSQNPKRLKY